MNLKADTIRGYLRAAAELYTDRDRDRPDPFSTKLLKTNYPKIVCDALGKYEGLPNRREIVTDSMFEYVDKQAEGASPDSREKALKNWLAWSRYSGPRRSEWCQTAQTSYEEVANMQGEARSIRDDDVELFDADDRLLDPTRVTFDKVEYVEVRWRWQKNGDNHEKIKYFREDDHPRWCPCFAMFEIKRRALRLKIPSCEPIAQYRDETGQILYITAHDVTRCLRDAAKKCLGITDEKTLSRWSSHSLRVTAANELHRLGFTDAFIKLRLRWKSDSFMKYLRHTVHVARMHSAAMRLSPRNLAIRTSNISKVNAKYHKMQSKVYRKLGSSRILWDEHSLAASAA